MGKKSKLSRTLNSNFCTKIHHCWILPWVYITGNVKYAQAFYDLFMPEANSKIKNFF